ncbi:uncharacterized protein LOC114477813 isoform X2 [Gouania willdenowi]|uniref:uncharacterized protein LOC114477813 isoform X2 n=1 Tax=Gouania willdenowi TaxID=441366 RepID=UPI0010562CC2|nr:uncharacterized protein LOC114477813 isoform X2 [Gouania willdenowi]
MDDKLIVAVCDHPELYNTASYWYRDRTKKDLAWRTIGEAVGLAEVNNEGEEAEGEGEGEDAGGADVEAGGAHVEAGGADGGAAAVARVPANAAAASPAGSSAAKPSGRRAKKRPSQGPSEMDLVIMEALRRPPPSPPPPMSADEMFLKSLLPTLQRVPPENREFVKLQMYKVLVDNLPVTLNLENFE